MASKWKAGTAICALALSLMPNVYAGPKDGKQSGVGNSDKIRHVLLLSIDGQHALDVANYVKAHPESAMAELSEHGITYSNARTPANSDSFPGLLALITGGSPNSHGLFYDVSYDRTMFATDNVSCKGRAGNMMVYDESIDLYKGVVSKKVIDKDRM